LIWQLAGIVGIDPMPLSLRELIWMAESRRNEAWSHTANLMALVANVNRNPRKRARPYSPLEFHPFLERKRTAYSKASIRILKDVFVRK
jgi:hypothetical protein